MCLEKNKLGFFGFGYKQSAFGKECSVDIVDSVLDDGGVKISSTRLREMIEKGGDRTVITMNNIKKNPDIDDSLFDAE